MMNEALFDEQIERLINWYRYEKYVRQILFDLLDEVQAHILAGSLKNDLNAQLAYIENVLMNAYDKVEEYIQPEPMVEAQSDYLFWLMTGLAAAYGVQKIIKPLAKAQQEKLVQQFTVGGLTLPEMLNKQRSDFVLKLKIAYRQAAVDDALPEQDELNALFMRHKQNVQTMTKTLINSVVNETAYQFASINPVIEGFRHVAVLDSHTTMVCTHRNGLVWDLDGKPYAHHEPFKKPPLHPNCRSCLVYVADISAPFDGVSGENWVKSRRLDELQAQFGKGIGQMLYDGKIQLYEALDGLKPLTLTDLRKKHTQSVHSNEFTQRFATLYHDVKSAKANKQSLDDIKATLVHDRVWFISHINQQTQKWLKATTDKVWISEDTLVKQFFKHPELKIDVYQKIVGGLNHAEKIIGLNDKKIALFKIDKDIFELVVKTTKKRDELYLVSVFKADDKEVKRIDRLGVSIQE